MASAQQQRFPWRRWAIGTASGVLVWVLMLCSGITAALQSSTLAWPVPIPQPGSEHTGWLAGGWQVSSAFGWRDAVQQPPKLEFHDGVDLVGESFCLQCPVPALYDGTVSYIGWDDSAAEQPDRVGGGQIVTLDNGKNPNQPWAYPEMRAVFAHLDPYRLHLQLQGRIADPWNQAAYVGERDYQPVGTGHLPLVDAAVIVTTCQSTTRGGKVPEFVWTAVGPGTYEAVYDSPGTCTTAVEWPAIGNGWTGWIPDSASEQHWRTPIEAGVQAGDVALRFRAHLVPPPPLPTPTTLPASTAVPQPHPSVPADAAGGDAPADGASDMAQAAGVVPAQTRKHTCETEEQLTRCRWRVSDIPSGWSPQASPVRDQVPLFPVTPAEPAGETPTGGTFISTTDAAYTALPSTTTTSMGTRATAMAYRLEDVTAPAALHGDRNKRAIASDAVDDASGWSLATSSPQANSLGSQQALRGAMRMEGVAAATAWPAVGQRTAQPSGSPDCSWKGLVSLPGVSAPRAQLQADVAASFAQVRAEIRAQTGVDALARLSEALRPADYGTSKPGVLYTSWHKAGRAVDLFIPYRGSRFNVVRDGALFRIYVGTVDITAIFERHGWNRIPPQGSTSEWWHYEYHGDGISWQSAMLQIYSKEYLQLRLPQFDWDIGCAADTSPPTPSDGNNGGERIGFVCQPGVPHWTSDYEELSGCGPPVTLGSPLRMLDQRVGFVGMTGRTTGPHLHLGLQVKTAAVSYGGYPLLDVCAAPWTPEHLRDLPPDDVHRVIWQEHGQSCWTDTVDPLDFLPRAHGTAPLPEATAAPLIDEPYQLPPPGTTGALLQPAPSEAGLQEVGGEYWSPYAAEGRFGGGGILAWFCDWLTWLGYRPAWCQ